MSISGIPMLGFRIAILDKSALPETLEFSRWR
jgi:hypothetical protein